MEEIQLPQLLKHLNLPMIAAEIGVAEGLNANDLINAGIEKLYAVDAWEQIPGQKGDGSFDSNWHNNNYNDAVQRLLPHGDKVIFLRGRSREMAQKIEDNTLGLLYLDGDHSYSGVTNDLVAYHSKVVKGGVIAGHDFLQKHYGVKEAVEDFCKEHGYEINVLPENKEEDAGFYFIKL
jgi:hypothetical protein